MLTQEEIGRRVRAAREERRLSQSALGERFGRTHAAISDIERGKTKVGLADLARLAEILEKPLAYFTATEGTPLAVFRRGEQDLLPDEERRLERTLEGFKEYARRIARERGAPGPTT
jgi:transcriptional regulator with XRE-family HTH domain